MSTTNPVLHLKAKVRTFYFQDRVCMAGRYYVVYETEQIPITQFDEVTFAWAMAPNLPTATPRVFADNALFNLSKWVENAFEARLRKDPVFQRALGHHRWYVELRDVQAVKPKNTFPWDEETVAVVSREFLENPYRRCHSHRTGLRSKQHRLIMVE